MIMNFTALCTTLNLSPAGSSEQLASLKQWCEDNISRDISYTGTDDERYQRYMALAREYLEQFMPAVPDDVLQPVSAFEGLNTVLYAAYCGYHPFLSQTLKRDAKICNTSNEGGMTALHLAALNGHCYTVETLLAAGAQADKVNHNRQYPVFSALMVPINYDDNLIPNKITVFNLLKKKAPETVKAVDISGETVAHLMAANGFGNLIDDLIAQNPELLLIKNNDSKYPVHTAILNNQPEIVQSLIAVPEIRPLQDNEGQMAIHYAAKFGSEEMISLCCKGNIDVVDFSGRTPLMLAAEAGNLIAAQTLISKGANTALLDNAKQTVLHYAVQSQNRALVSWILDNTAVDINAKNFEGQTALFYVQDEEMPFYNKEVEGVLLAKGGLR